MNEAAEIISAYRRKHGMSRPRFAVMAGVRRAAVYKWEKGMRAPSVEAAKQIEEATGAEITKEQLRPDIWTHEKPLAEAAE